MQLVYLQYVFHYINSNILKKLYDHINTLRKLTFQSSMSINYKIYIEINTKKYTLQPIKYYLPKIFSRYLHTGVALEAFIFKLRNKVSVH